MKLLLEDLVSTLLLSHVRIIQETVFFFYPDFKKIPEASEFQVVIRVTCSERGGPQQ